MFTIVLLACLVPVAIGAAIVLYDEAVAMEGGFHKKHI